jgi:hypothetical protein
MGSHAILTPQHVAAPPRTATDGMPLYLFRLCLNAEGWLIQRAWFSDLRLRIEPYHSSAAGRRGSLAHERKTCFCDWCCTERTHVCQYVRCRFTNLKAKLANTFNTEPPGRPTHLLFQTGRRRILAQRLSVWPYTNYSYYSPYTNLAYAQDTPSQEEQRSSCTSLVNLYLLI